MISFERIILKVFAISFVTSRYCVWMDLIENKGKRVISITLINNFFFFQFSYKNC